MAPSQQDLLPAIGGARTCSLSDHLPLPPLSPIWPPAPSLRGLGSGSPGSLGVFPPLQLHAVASRMQTVAPWLWAGPQAVWLPGHLLSGLCGQPPSVMARSSWTCGPALAPPEPSVLLLSLLHLVNTHGDVSQPRLDLAYPPPPLIQTPADWDNRAQGQWAAGLVWGGHRRGQPWPTWPPGCWRSPCGGVPRTRQEECCSLQESGFCHVLRDRGGRCVPCTQGTPDQAPR